MKIFKYISKLGWCLLAVAVGLLVLQVWLDLKSPEYMQQITLLIETDGSEMRDVWINGGWMLLCCLGSLLTSVCVAIISSKIASDFSATLRAKVYEQVMSYSPTEFRKFSTASLITRTTNDITQVTVLITMGLQMLIRAPIIAIWALIKISNSAWQWTMTVGIAVALLVVVVAIIIAIVLPKFRKLQKLTDNLNRVTRENLSGLPVVRAYNADQYQMDKFYNANEELCRTNLFTSRTLSFLNPTIQLIMNGISLAIYWIGAFLIEALDVVTDRIELFSEMVVFSSYAMQVVMAFMMLVMIFIILPRSIVSINRINQVLNTEPSIKDGPGFTVSDINDEEGNLVRRILLDKDGNEVPSVMDEEGNVTMATKGEITFDHVYFSYADSNGEEAVISDINFHINKGETVAFIGATGCGKSTIINLIPRFYDTTEGEVYVDGINIKDYKQEDLRSKIGYISQKSTLFSGTIRENIDYGDNNADEKAIEDALHVSQSSSFVNKLNDGVDAYVAQNGDNYSGGQKQRISIARGIARRPEILIFDDTFSALDFATDKRVRKALKTYCEGSTKLIVSQRIGTIKDADQIFVVEDGKIVGAGKHADLIETCETYKEIALSQLSAEEL